VTAAAPHHRPVDVDDLPAIIELIAASDLATIGRTDFTATEVEGDLRDVRKEHQGWYDDEGTLVAYGWVTRDGDSPKIELDAYVHPAHDISVGVELVTTLEARGRELAAAAGHDHAIFHANAYREDERTRQWLRERGFEIGTTFTRMRIDFDEPFAPGPLPPGVTVRRSDANDDDLRVAHEIEEAAFAEHYGHVWRSFDRFRERFFELSDTWCSLWLAELDGTPVGLLVANQQFVEDDNAGYIRSLGVTRAARGHGVAKALLRQHFAASQAEGRVAVLLHVDVSNVTNALGVYESVGMRPILEIDAWAKRAAVEVVDSGTPL
jgi:mycothiol synthase